jgi:hypothetical protein
LRCKAIVAYEPEGADQLTELSFTVGDIIVVTHQTTSRVWKGYREATGPFTVVLGLGRIIALYDRSFASYQIH